MIDFDNFCFSSSLATSGARARGSILCPTPPKRSTMCVYTQGMFERDRRRWKERERERECAQNAPRERSDITAYSMCMCVTRLLGPISCVCVCRSKLLLFWEKAAQKCACRVRETKNERKNRKREKCVGLILEQKSKEVVLCKNCQKCFLEPLLISVSNDSKYRLYPSFASYFTFN